MSVFSATTLEWIAVGIFFTCLFAFSLTEGVWLNKADGVPFGKAFAYSFATNTFAISIGFFVSFVIFVLLMMLVFEGSFEGMSGNDWRIWTPVIVGLLFPVLLLIAAKRLALPIFKMTTVEAPWIYSAAASVIFMILVVSIPVLFIYAAS